MCLCETGPCVKIHFPWITKFFHSSQHSINWKYFFCTCERALFLFFIMFSLILVCHTKFIVIQEVLCFHIRILYPLKLSMVIINCPYKTLTMSSQDVIIFSS